MNNIVLPHNHGDLSEGLKHGMPDSNNFAIVADVFKMLADSRRVQIFWLLCHCEECVINISALLEMSSPAVSHHLSNLKTAGFIVSRREGKEVYYTAAKTPRTELMHIMIEQIVEVSCPVSESFEDSKIYDTNVGIITAIHDFLVENLNTRYTIEELSEKFHINQTTLKLTFKMVYGLPVARYMKEYRIKNAKELLMHTDDSIAQIAQMVGYENQSKFTQAFKDVLGVLPKDFRKK